MYRISQFTLDKSMTPLYKTQYLAATLLFSLEKVMVKTVEVHLRQYHDAPLQNPVSDCYSSQFCFHLKKKSDGKNSAP